MNLLDYKKDLFSSTGNDGIIEKIFNVLDIKNGFFVEFGAWDGIKGSNCRKLSLEDWSGIFIEADRLKFTQLEYNYMRNENIKCICSAIDCEANKFDNIVNDYIKGNIDFCSIDIDGLDLEIFESFEKFMPTVVCLEGGQMLEPNFKRVPEAVAKLNIQQSLGVINNSFEEKGYKLLCSYQDSFFVKKELYDKFDVSTDLTELYIDGLYAHHRRLPWIQAIIAQSNLKNKFIDYVLQQSNYSQYGYDNRKVWAVEQKDLALTVINKLRDTAVQKNL